MIEKLEEIKLRFEEVGLLLAQPDTVNDMKKFSQLSKEYRDLEKIVVKYNQYKDARGHLQQAKEVLEKEKEENAIFELASAVFESTVRLANSNPALWVPIFLQN